MFRCASKLGLSRTAIAEGTEVEDAQGMLSQDSEGPLHASKRSNTLNPKLKTILFDTDFTDYTELKRKTVLSTNPHKSSRINNAEKKSHTETLRHGGRRCLGCAVAGFG